MSKQQPSKESQRESNHPAPHHRAASDSAEADARAMDEVLEESLADPADEIFQSQSVASLNSGSSLESQLAASQREVLRVRAEMENFRKRMQRDSDQQLKYANVPLVRDLIEVVDNLNRALDAASHDAAGPAAAHTTALREGVGMVLQQLGSVLSKYGCKPIESVGHEFDPNVHEAIAQMSSQEYAAGVVMQEVAAGYLLHDRVVRPSSVIVSSGQPPS